MFNRPNDKAKPPEEQSQNQNNTEEERVIDRGERIEGDSAIKGGFDKNSKDADQE